MTEAHGLVKRYGSTMTVNDLSFSQSNGIPRSRVDEVLRIVGLEGVARRRAKGFSLGMGQRLLDKEASLAPVWNWQMRGVRRYVQPGRDPVCVPAQRVGVNRRSRIDAPGGDTGNTTSGLTRGG